MTVVIYYVSPNKRRFYSILLNITGIATINRLKDSSFCAWSLARRRCACSYDANSHVITSYVITVQLLLLVAPLDRIRCQFLNVSQLKALGRLFWLSHPLELAISFSLLSWTFPVDYNFFTWVSLISFRSQFISVFLSICLSKEFV